MAEITADGDIIVGRRRPKNNPLIRRIEVGKPAFHNDLPQLPPDYTFGAPLKRDPEGAGDVMLTWHEHAPPKNKLSYDFGRDFTALNRKSAGCTNAKEAADFRKDNDARIMPKVSERGKKPLIAPAAIMSDPNHAFGAKSEHSERVADLIQNRWEYEWVAEQRKRCEALEQAKTVEKKKHAAPKANASVQRRIDAIKAQREQSVTPTLKESFTLPQFRNVQSRFAKTPTPDY